MANERKLINSLVILKTALKDDKLDEVKTETITNIFNLWQMVEFNYLRYRCSSAYTAQGHEYTVDAYGRSNEVNKDGLLHKTALGRTTEAAYRIWLLKKMEVIK